MIIQGVTLTGIGVYDSSFNSNGALLYVDAGQTASYSGSGTTWTDLSGNTNNGTLMNSPTYSRGYGGYFVFNGSTNYVSTAAAKYNTTLTGKTVIVMARMNNSAWTNGLGQFRGMFGVASGSRNFNFYMYHDTSNNFQLHYSANGAGGFSNNLAITTNQWYVFAVTQTTGGLVTYYLNGVAVGTNTGITFAQYVSGVTENIGTNDNVWYGDIAMTAVYKRALNDSEMLQNYNSLKNRFNYVSSGLVLYYDPSISTSYPGSSTTVYDLSGNGLNGTMSNVTYTSPYFTYNGTSSQVSIADNALLEPGSGSWTIEVWVNQTVSGNDVVLGKFNAGGATQNVSYAIRTTGTTHYCQFSSGSGSGSTLYVNSTNFTVTIGTWYQLVYVFTNGATKTLETYVNGSSIGSVSHNLASVLNATTNLYLGSYNGGEYAQWYDGKIGITRMYSSALSAADVLQNYNNNKTNYGLS